MYVEEIFEHFDYANKYTRNYFRKWYKRNPYTCLNYLGSIYRSEYSDIINTKKDGNYIFNPGYFNFFELYDSSNSNELKELFYALEHLGKPKSGTNYNSCILDLQKCMKELSSENYKSIIHSFNNFYIPLESDTLDCIYIRLEKIGSNLFRIDFSFLLNDNIRYLYWNYLTYGVNKEVKISISLKRRCHLITTTNIETRLKEIYSSLDIKVYNEANNFLKKNFQGLMFKLLNEFPCTIVHFYDNENYFSKIKNVYFVTKDSSFNAFNYLLDCNTVSYMSNDRFIEENNKSCFIPISTSNKSNMKLLNKHLCKNDSYSNLTTVHLTWNSTIDYLLLLQYKKSLSILHKYYSKDIGKHYISYRKTKKEINKIDTLVKIIRNENSFYDEFMHGKYHLDSRKYILKINDTRHLEYFETYQKRISSKLELLDQCLPQIKEIYLDRYTQSNTTLNTILQFVILFFTALTLFFTAKQSLQKENNNIQSPNEDRKQINDIKHNAEGFLNTSEPFQRNEFVLDEWEIIDEEEIRTDLEDKK